MRATSWPRSVSALAIVRRMSPVEIWGQPNCFISLSAWVPLPAPGAPSRTMIFPHEFDMERSSLALRARDAAATQSAPTRSEEPVVVAHDELRFDLLHRVHRDADDDQEARTAEAEVEPHAGGDPRGDDVGPDRVVDRGSNPRELLEGDA